MTYASAIYEGTLGHARGTPVRHAFRHRLYMFALDLGELPRLTRELRLFGHERRRLVSVRDRDYLTDEPGRAASDPRRAPTAGLDASLRAFLRARGVRHDDGRTVLVTHARVLGYVFNPVSFFHCLAPDGTRRAIVAEVNNTFGDTHRYLLDERNRDGDGHFTDKLLHVSPFNDLRMGYRWRFDGDGDAPRYAVAMDVVRGGKTFLRADLRLERRELSDRALASTLVRHPMLPLRVTAWIHVQALRLYRKGAPFHAAPPYDPDAARRMHDREGSRRPDHRPPPPRGAGEEVAAEGPGAVEARAPDAPAA